MPKKTLRTFLYPKKFTEVSGEAMKTEKIFINDMRLDKKMH